MSQHKIQFDLHKLKMNVIETAGNGVVNYETIFTFSQKNDVISAKYTGGQVMNGYLAGRLKNDKFHFKYAQQHMDQNIAGGSSSCDLVRLHNGKLQMIENFEWEQGQGRNVFQEL